MCKGRKNQYSTDLPGWKPNDFASKTTFSDIFFCRGFEGFIVCALSCGVPHCTCLQWRVNSVGTLSWEHIGRTDTLCCGLFSPPLSTGPGVVFRFSLKAVLCYVLSFFFMNSFLMKWSPVPKHIKCSWEVTMEGSGAGMCVKPDFCLLSEHVVWLCSGSTVVNPLGH